MKFVKKSLLALAIAAAVATPSFAAVTSQGITWEPGSVIGGFNFRQQIVAGELKGLGEFYSWGFGPTVNIGSASGGAAGSFAVGRELTLEFGGFNLQAGPSFSNTGWLNIYSDNNNDFFPTTAPTFGTNYAAANNSDYGTPFLMLASTNVTFTGSVASGTLDVYWDVVGGSAMAFFDTDTLFATSFTDVFSSARTNFNGNPLDGSFSRVGANGQVDLYSVPEPGSLALLGLGLIGLAAARRRKAA